MSLESRLVALAQAIGADVKTLTETPGVPGPAGADGAQGIQGVPGASNFQIGHTVAVGGEIRVVVGDIDVIPGFYVPVMAGTTVKLAKIRARIGSGTSATFKVQINGVDAVTGIVAVPGGVVNDPADIPLADGDIIQVIITAVSVTPKNLTVTLILQHGV